MRSVNIASRAVVLITIGLVLGWLTANRPDGLAITAPAAASQVTSTLPPPATGEARTSQQTPSDAPVAFSCPIRGPFGIRDTFHSQFYEDYILSYVFKDVARGVYVDVGAHDPDVGSVTKHFYLKGWRGLNVEPNPEFQAALRKARPDDENVGVGISDEAATLQFFRFETRASGLSTFDRDIALRHQAAGFRFDELTIPVMTLTSVLQDSDKISGGFEFLNVDVEGFEKKVLAGLDFKKYPPTVVMIEATAPLTEAPTHQNWESILYAAGYVFALDDGLNRYYLHAAQRDRLQRFVEVNYCIGQDKIAKRIKLDGFLPEGDR
jgi:FkbM family methyltransferase